MYELIILSVLMQHSVHGYLIAKALNNILGPFAKVNNGRLYPLLTRLEKDGLIERLTPPSDVPENRRHVNSFEITQAGREYFRQLMLDTISNPSEYQKIFWLKAPVLYLLRSEEQVGVIEHYINYCQSHVLHLTTKLKDYAPGDKGQVRPANLTAVFDAIEHRQKHWQLELEWANSLRAGILQAQL